MRRGIYYLLVIAVVLGAALYGFSGPEGQRKFIDFFAGTVRQRPQVATVRFPDATVIAEIASTPEAQRQGLSGRVSLGDDEGMLFVYSQPGPYQFWMKGMRFPLDVIWLRDGTVVDMVLDAPVPTDVPPILTSVSLANSVLEVNAGFVARHNIKIGTTAAIRFDGFKN